MRQQLRCAFIYATFFLAVPFLAHPAHAQGNGEWAWVSGASTANQGSTYGTKGTPASGNVPGERQGAVEWTDLSGNFWLFGGYGKDSHGTVGYLDELWEYSGGLWAWIGGSNIANQLGTYGIQGVAAATNSPGARVGAATWTDAAGNFWLFGGGGYASTGDNGHLNDLWEYSNGEWTWVGGSNLRNDTGNYGSIGVAAATNIPPALYFPMTWTDAAGNFWLLGGQLYNNTSGVDPYLNALWKYSGGLWTWVGGSNVPNEAGVYGIMGTPDAANFPGARAAAFAWTDATGNFWLFGGGGWDSAGTNGNLNDLWEYKSGSWTWVGGPDIANQPGTYGTKGVAAAANVPGARGGGFAWTDAAGNFWLFGGSGTGAFNDLWEYKSGSWTWVGGPDIANQPGTYGTKGVAAAANIPGARSSGVSWTDTTGNFWLFGGCGPVNCLNDLWEYQPVTGLAIGVVPDVVGDTRPAAALAIGGAGLAIGSVTTAASSTVAPGIVITETPLSGTPVPLGSPVNFVISTGAPHLVTTLQSITLNGATNQYVVVLGIANTGNAPASNLALTAALLNRALPAASLPVSVGSANTVTLNFPLTAGAPGSIGALTFTLTYTGGSSGGGFRVVLP